jgi:hypothetical protein
VENLLKLAKFLFVKSVKGVKETIASSRLCYDLKLIVLQTPINQL